MNHEIKFIYKKMKTRIVISNWKPKGVFGRNCFRKATGEHNDMYLLHTYFMRNFNLKSR